MITISRNTAITAVTAPASAFIAGGVFEQGDNWLFGLACGLAIMISPAWLLLLDWRKQRPQSIADESK